MSKKKLLITDGFSPDGLEVLEDSGLFEISLHKGLEEQQLRELLPSHDAVIIRSATKLKGDNLPSGTALKAIMRAGSGVDNIDVEKASKLGILVFNTPGANNNAVVELTLGMAFAMVRELPRAVIGMKAGKWEKKQLVGCELEGRTLGVLGLGAIGASVARKAHALGMRVIGFDPRANELDLGNFVDKVYDNMEDVFRNASMITVHVPLMDATRDSIGAKQFELLEKGSYLINCARGGIVHEGDLLAALEQGMFVGVAMDVFAKEPTEAGNPLVQHPNFIATPHIGAATKESQKKVALAAAKGLIRYFQEGDRSTALNSAQVE